MNQETIYQKIHDQLGRTLPNGFPKMRQMSDRYNIISGMVVSLFVLHSEQVWNKKSFATKSTSFPITLPSYFFLLLVKQVLIETLGAYIGPAEDRCHKLKSGNKVLQKLRVECHEGLLGWIIFKKITRQSLQL